jgi:hypothetical protein
VKKPEKIYVQDDFPALENLYNILDELFLEYSSTYAYYYRMMINFKENGSFKPNLLESF